jgi:hypothetical protein
MYGKNCHVYLRTIYSSAGLAVDYYSIVKSLKMVGKKVCYKKKLLYLAGKNLRKDKVGTKSRLIKICYALWIMVVKVS